MIQIKNIEENYFIGTDGNVYRQLKPWKASKYKDIKINGKHRLIHRLVAEAFVENPHGYTEVNHKDLNRDNNTPENLEWCTHQQNMIHSFKHKSNIRNFVECDLLIDDTFHKSFGSIKEAIRYAQQLGYSASMLEKHRKHKNASLLIKKGVTTIQ